MVLSTYGRGDEISYALFVLGSRFESVYLRWFEEKVWKKVRFFGLK